MKASELRIGNLVNYGNAVKQLDAELFLQLLKYTTPFEPIHLTEQWLLKFGFEEKNIGNKLPESWYELKYLSNEHEPMITSWVSILINIETWSCVICDEYPDEIGANTKIKIEYVHQLQNLYFALTGEELTFKSE